MLEPVPAAYRWRQGTPLDESPAHHKALPQHLSCSQHTFHPLSTTQKAKLPLKKELVGGLVKIKLNFVHPLFIYVYMGDARNQEKQALLWTQWMKQQIGRRMEACLRGLLWDLSKVACIPLFQAIVSSLPVVQSVMVDGTIFWSGLAIRSFTKIVFYPPLFALFHLNRNFLNKNHAKHSITTEVANLWTFSFCQDEFIHSHQKTL